MPPDARCSKWKIAAASAVLALAMYGDTLVVPGRVPSGITTDLRSQYLLWRQFAFDQIRHGHFPLWNPYAFCGTPFFGDPQSAMLYPPNWLNLFLPPARAASWLVVIHVFLASFFTGLWCRRRRASAMAAILAGVIYAGCGPIVANVTAGHLPLLCSAAWAPLLLCCVEDVLTASECTARLSIMLGVGAVAMLALDGYPQFAYYSALAAGIYALLLLPACKRRWRAAASVAVMFAGGAAIAAAQIMAAMQFAAESVRAGGLSLASASDFSLPPENLLTMLVPGLFGDGMGLPYYGRWFFWETCLFVGPTALILAAWGIRRERRAISIAALAGVMLVLAMGGYTPLFGVLFHLLPGFASFRAPARFGLLGVLCVAVLAAGGWDRVADGSRGRAAIGVACGLGLALGAAAIYAMHAAATGGFAWVIHALAATHQSFELAWLIHPTFAARAASFAATQLSRASLAMLVTAGLLASAAFAAPRRRRLAVVLLAWFAVAQTAWFGYSQRTSSDEFMPPRRGYEAALASVPAGSRVLVTTNWLADAGERDGFLNIGGYNPLVLARTARYLAAVEEQGVDGVGQNDPMQVRDRLLRLLRGAMVLPGWPSATPYAVSDPLPRLLLVDHYKLAAGPDAALAATLADSFDCARTVVLESAPRPPPQASDGDLGQVRLLGETCDELEIEADLPGPRVLLVTDAYSSGWRAVPVDAGDSRIYQVMPADGCLRAIPLAAGRHHFLLEYRPRAVMAGTWISLAAAGIYVATGAWLMIAVRRDSRRSTEFL